MSGLSNIDVGESEKLADDIEIGGHRLEPVLNKSYSKKKQPPDFKDAVSREPQKSLAPEGDTNFL